MNLLARLREGRPILMDGAMGTELIRRGYTGPSWRANIDASELVQQIHSDYIAAGAELILLNTFLIPSITDRREQFTAALRGCAIRRSPVLELASLGPQRMSGDNFADFGAMVKLILDWFTFGDTILIETCSDLSVFELIQQVGEHTSIPMSASFTFHADPSTAELLTYAGLTAEAVAKHAEEVGVFALGVNCGLDQSPAMVAEVVRRYRSVTSLPIMARPNAGSPRYGVTTPMAPEVWAEETMKVVDAGATLVGGCCGTTPEHIAALKQRL
jgi:5-methyltetrahydrofolate--homocysteine methyltransferase